MISSKQFFVTFLLTTLVLSQTNFGSACSSNSLMPRLATGVMNLNPLDTYNNGANKDYYQDLTSSAFNINDYLGYAFALSGFQTPCGQPYYSLSVDKVYFDNQNTRMRVIVNFKNSNLANTGTITSWNMVTYTYIVVSKTFTSSTTSDIWATTAQTTPPAVPALAAIDTVGNSFPTTAPTLCAAVFTDPTLTFGASTVCAETALTGQMAIHAYITGFRFNSNTSATTSLGAGIFKSATAAGSFNPVDTNELTFTFTFAAAPAALGPQVIINSYSGALQYLKVGFVFSKLKTNVADRAANLQFTYPFGSDFGYSSSYIWMPVTTFNTSVPVTHTVSTSSSNANKNFYRLPDHRYAIYGLTSFTLPKSATTSCTTLYVNATLNTADSIIVNTFTTNPQDFYFAADIFTKRVDQICSSNVPTTISTFNSKIYLTTPTTSAQFIQQVTTTPVGTAAFSTTVTTIATPTTATYYIFYVNKGANADTVTLSAQLPYTGLTPGAPVVFEFDFFDSLPVVTTLTGASGMIKDVKYTVQLIVNDFTLFYQEYTGTKTGTALLPGTPTDGVGGKVAAPKFRGLNIGSNIANAIITVTLPRNSVVNQYLYAYIRLFQFGQAYDPTTGCCTAACPLYSGPLNSGPLNSGLDIMSNPQGSSDATPRPTPVLPICVKCDTNAGLVYNSANGTCTCSPGFYLDSSSTFQCFPCTALYCSTCSATNPAICTTCVIGATLNSGTQSCTCGAGYFVNGTQCQRCPNKCGSCSSPNGICTSCSDTLRRIPGSNCDCAPGFYDSGVSICTACPFNCLTCLSATSCTSCDPNRFRVMNNSICQCIAKYYEVINTDQTRSCQACSPVCLTCSIAPTSCTSCDPTKNRFPGVDSGGRSTCVCQVGFYSNAVTGECIQTNCIADSLCSQCLSAGGIQVCAQCQSSLNRIVQNPAGVCVCASGYFETTTTPKVCVACSAGCATCTSATSCLSCVQLATLNANGGCSCPSQTFFSIALSGIRYCAPCGSNCAVCTDSITCTTCLPTLTLVNNVCSCPPSSFVNSAGSCAACSSGCLSCNATACLSCIAPLVLQGTQCQNSCNSGSTLIGASCVSCPTGCLQCTQNLICYYCANNLFNYKGNCFATCPSGTMSIQTNGTQTCVPCNAPCATCTGHPSFCTSCVSGQGFLQTSSALQSCVSSCNEGTFASNGLCMVCSFTCATCVGSSTNCLTCPTGLLLFNNTCVNSCPGIFNGNVCSFSCPPGNYNVSLTSCAACASTCLTCIGSATNCTSCPPGLFANNNGACLSTCPSNTFGLQGFCLGCSISCNGCTQLPTNCINCATGYVRSGSICQRSCGNGQYLVDGSCRSCDTSCATCTTGTSCTSCANPLATLTNGVCNLCPGNCAVCSPTTLVCTTCSSGFFLFQSACVSSCPSGSYSFNGACICQNGFALNGQCFTTCPSGFYGINGQCQRCSTQCLQCSGSSTTCTACLSGFTLNSATGTCTSTTTNNCPYGQASNNGVCQNICPSGFFFYQGVCYFGSCISGFVTNNFGGCVEQTNPTPTTNCPPGQFLSQNGCTTNCPSGTYPDTITGRCLACSANCVNCFSGSVCVTCQSGYQSINGACAQVTSCANGQILYGSQCVSACPVGTYQANSQCFRSCPVNTFYFSMFCYADCPTNQRTNEACVNNCPLGTILSNGVCQ